MKARFFTSETVVRMVADIAMLNAALCLALLLRFLMIDFQMNSAEQYRAIFWQNSLVLSLPALIIFSLFGFYSRGRAYSSRYKMLVITQATTVLFVIVGLGEYAFGSNRALSQGALFDAWLLTTTALVLARMWSGWWKSVVIRTAATSVETGQPTVLVIGGAGYIGSSLLPKLLKSGYKVRLFDCFMYGDEPIAACRDHQNLEIIRADFRQVDQVVSAMKGVSTVVHLGAIVGDPACAVDEDLTLDINLVATRMIAEVAKGHGIERFIFASTCSVYGASDDILDETSDLNPVSLYAKSKIACERVLLGMKDAHFSPVILRFGTIYGLSGRTRFDLVVNLLAAKAVMDGEITVMGSDQWRPFVHVADASSAVLSAVEARAEQLQQVIFNVGSNEQNLTLGELGELINRIVPSAVIKVSDFNADRRNYNVDFRRIRQNLGFSPEWSLESGIRQVIRVIDEGQVVNYRDARYYNVQVINAQCVRLKGRKDWADQLIKTSGRPYAPTVATAA
jgi:nucleoside-diphosphate-sugar epimerase